jgi:hypothetical protein
MQETDPDLLLRRYLLGELPSDEANAIEARLFLDDEYAEMLAMVEEDLVDDYLYDDVSGAERTQFEKIYLSTEAHRETLGAARALKGVLAKPASKPLPEPRTRTTGWFPWFGADRAWWQVPVAVATILLLLVGAWLLIRAIQKRPPQEAHTPPVPGGTREAPAPSPESPAPGPQPDERVQKNPPETPLPPPPGTAPKERTSSVFAVLVMTSSPTRSETNERTKVEPGTSETVELRLPIMDEVGTGAFTVVLLNEAGRPILKRSNLRPKKLPGLSSKGIIFFLPAKQLTPQDYQILLKQQTPRGLEDVRYYFFYVRKP